jgi:hypothetical protein
MGANRYMVDGGGTTRHIRKRYAVDAGGTARLIKKRYIIDAGGTARLTFLAAEAFTGISGAQGGIGIGFSAPFDFGTLNGQPLGTPMALYGGPLAPGFTSLLLQAMYNTPSGGALLEVDGFASDPGPSWLTNLTVGSTIKTPSDAGATYTWKISPHSATWQWTTPFPSSSGGFGGPPFSGSISHN